MMPQDPNFSLQKGTFLISSLGLEKGTYARSVVLLCEHNPTGSFGLIINKPLNMEFPEELLDFHEVHNPSVVILSGGNIQQNQMMLLHSSSAIPDQTLEICDGVFLGGNLEFLQEQLSKENGSHIRLCFGYTAWEAGQLEQEMLAGVWFSHPASKQYTFETPPAQIWPLILKSMGGKYSTFSMIPEDLSLN